MRPEPGAGGAAGAAGTTRRVDAARLGPRLAVDWIRCDGYGLCGDLLPELIDLDDWRFPILRPVAVPPARMDDAQRAIDCCPMRALRLARDRHA